MKFSSSPLLMFRDFLISIAGDAAMITLAAGILMAWLKPDIGLTDIPLCGIAVFLFFISIGGVAIGGRVTVEVTDDAVVITRPLEEPLRLPRAQWRFSARAHSYFLYRIIPITANRFLIAYSPSGGRVNEYVLTNLSKRSLDALMTVLLRDRTLAEISAAPEEEMEKRLHRIRSNMRRP